TPYPAYVQHITPRSDKTRQASHSAMSAQFWNRASIKQKIPVTILYILLFSVFLRLFFRHTDKFIRCQFVNGRDEECT
ncbi:TPA: hypothetical protein ACHG4M_003132, partial [Escherichia coli]